MFSDATSKRLSWISKIENVSSKKVYSISFNDEHCRMLDAWFTGLDLFYLSSSNAHRCVRKFDDSNSFVLF